MVKIFNGEYGISSDEYQYIIGKISKTKDKITGEEKESLRDPVFVKTIEQCFRHIVEVKRLKEIKDCDDWEELVERFKKINEELDMELNIVREALDKIKIDK